MTNKYILDDISMNQQNGAQLLVKCLETQGVEYIFGIPGAKIDAVFNALLDSSIKLIVCRHEQNAAFMAAAWGRLTGKPGVVLVTSGPGVANLTTGLITATTEGDPIVALGGQVPRAMIGKQSHQSANNIRLMQAATKNSIEARLAETIPELIENAFRIAATPPYGACFISLPQDVLSESTNRLPINLMPPSIYGSANLELLQKVANIINKAKQPVILLGLEASRTEHTKAIRALLHHAPFSVVSTFQAAGVLDKTLFKHFLGRVGLFKNQPGDQLLDLADVVITIGYNPVEYDPETWNIGNKKTIIHIHNHPCDVHYTYHPVCELLGDISATINTLSPLLKPRQHTTDHQKIHRLHQALVDEVDAHKNRNQTPIHPLRFIHELQQAIDDETTICCDVGSVYMWMARYFFCYKPHQLLFSNGQQTLGVALPWAMACQYARPGRSTVSISGDGGFLFSAMELETAVREGLQFIHFIWRDGTYNMVLEQEMMKYHRQSGVQLGRVNIPDFARAFGAVGFELHDPNEFQTIFNQAKKEKKPVLIDVAIDYADNHRLFEIIDPNAGH